ncbi:MAG: hypothetical protein OXR71_11215, partial [Gemmatimonadota bacterium]|nr:hypothetical protein [Gemmatimonadota bacterium]
VTGEVVNIAFIVREWAETNVRKGIAATTSVSNNLDEVFDISQPTEINFRGIETPISICEIR